MKLTTYAIVDPADQTMGIKEKPRARLVESVSSPMALFMTPVRTQPDQKRGSQRAIRTYRYFRSACRRYSGCKNQSTSCEISKRYVYLMTSDQNDRDSPKQTTDRQRPNKPVRSTGLRPMRSDKRLHWSTVQACVAKNSDSCRSSKL